MTLGERAGSQNLREIYRVRKKFLDKVCIMPVFSDFAFRHDFFNLVLFPVSFFICLSNFIIIGDFSREICTCAGAGIGAGTADTWGSTGRGGANDV